MSDSLRPHEPQHARPPCPSPTPGVYPNSCPLSQYYPTISSSVIPFSFGLQSFPASGSFQTSQLFTSGGQSIGASASTSVLPMNTQDWSIFFRMDWLDLPAVVSCILFDSFCFIEKVNMVFFTPSCQKQKLEQLFKGVAEAQAWR